MNYIRVQIRKQTVTDIIFFGENGKNNRLIYGNSDKNVFLIKNQLQKITGLIIITKVRRKHSTN